MQAIAALMQMSTPNAHVRRGALHFTIPSSQLVLGAIVLLVPGDVDSAAYWLVDAANLCIVHAALTGAADSVDCTSEP